MVKEVVDLKNKVCGFDRVPGFADQPHSNSVMQGLPVCSNCGQFPDLLDQDSTSIILRIMMERNTGA